MKLSDNKVLITGGGSGIGLEMAKAFLDHQSEVTITGRNKEKLKKACAENPGLKYEVCDVTDVSQIEELLGKITASGGINILVNNAGVFNEINYAKGDVSSEEQAKEIDIDFTGPVRMTNYFLDHLKGQKNAALINVSSGLAFVPLAVAPVYCATKAGLHSWTRSLRFQLEGKIKVFELMPPLTDTPLIKEDWKKFNPIPTKELIAGFVKDFNKDKLEIVVGQSKGLRKMSKWAPKFIFKQLNKSFVQ